jgi:hypothetical protein
LFSLFLTFLLTGNSNSHPHSTFPHFKLHILPILFLFTLASLHSIAQAAHDNFHQQSFFSSDKNAIKNHLSRHHFHQQQHLDSSNNFPSSKSSQTSTNLLSFVFLSHQVHLFDKTWGFGTIRACNYHLSFSNQPLTLKSFRFRGEQAYFWADISTLQLSTSSCLGKRCQLSNHQHFRHLSQNSSTSHLSQITAFQTGSTVVRTLQLSQHATITSEGLPLLQHRLFLSHATKYANLTLAAHPTPLVSFSAGKMNTEESWCWFLSGFLTLLGTAYDHCFFCLLFSLAVAHLSVFSHLTSSASSWKTWETLHFDIATVGMRLTAYGTFCFIPSKKNWWSNKSACWELLTSLTIFRSFLLCENYSEENHLVKLSQPRQGSGKPANIRIWRMLLAEIISLMVEELSFYGARSGGFSAYGHWWSFESWVFGTKKDLFSAGLWEIENMTVWDIWLESGNGWGVLVFWTEWLVFDSEDLAVFINFGGMVSQLWGKRQGYLGQFGQAFCILDTIGRTFWQRQGGCFGIW